MIVRCPACKSDQIGVIETWEAFIDHCIESGAILTLLDTQVTQRVSWNVIVWIVISTGRQKARTERRYKD